MQIRKFYAKSVPAAMRDIRNLLGAEAVILSTRHLTTDDDAVVINGMRAAVEVTAAVDYDEAEPAAEPAAVAIRRLSGRRPLSRSSLRTPESLRTPRPVAETLPAAAGKANDSQLPRASLPSRKPLAWVDDAQAPATPARKVALRGILSELKSLQGALDKPDRSLSRTRVDRAATDRQPSAGHGTLDGDSDRSNPESGATVRGPLDHLVGQPHRSSLGRAAADLLNSRLRSDGVAPVPDGGRPWPAILDAYGPRPEAPAARLQPTEESAESIAQASSPASAESASATTPFAAWLRSSFAAAGPATPPFPASSAESPAAAAPRPAASPAPTAAPASPADNLPLPALRFRDHLLNQGVHDVLARSIVGAMHFTASHASREDLRGTFRRFVEVVATQVDRGAARRDMASVLTAPSHRSQGPRKLALVGPTGVGKTTTIAKIASYYALERHWDVALVTLDTYRVGAVEQLRIYSRLLGVPLEVVSDFGELSGALERLDDADLVLIDTPGHGPGDAPALERLAAALGRQEALEVMLVVAATLRRDEIRRVMRCFRPLGYGRLVFSKLDEAGRLGEVLNAWNESGLEVSYFTAGQRVPEDLEAASAETLCRRLLSRPA